MNSESMPALLRDMGLVLGVRPQPLKTVSWYRGGDALLISTPD